MQCGREPKPVLTRLWVHENMRVFQDRLVDTADKTYLQRLLHALLKSRFDTKLSYEVRNVTLRLLIAYCCVGAVCTCEVSYLPC